MFCSSWSKNKQRITCFFAEVVTRISKEDHAFAVVGTRISKEDHDFAVEGTRICKENHAFSCRWNKNKQRRP